MIPALVIIAIAIAAIIAWWTDDNPGYDERNPPGYGDPYHYDTPNEKEPK